MTKGLQSYFTSSNEFVDTSIFSFLRISIKFLAVFIEKYTKTTLQSLFEKSFFCIIKED